MQPKRPKPDPAEIIAREADGTVIQYWAERKPDAPAVYDRFGMRTIAKVNANANRLVRLMRDHGVLPGAHIAFISNNRAEVMEIMAANLRGGYRLVPINWHLTADEIAYILDDCDADALFVETKFPTAIEASNRTKRLKLKASLGGEAQGHVDLAAALASYDGSDIDDPSPGATMFYTSGTTGRPKGVYRESLPLLSPEAVTRYDFDTDVQLCAGPLYHGAPLTIETRTAMQVGVPVVYLERWDATEVLRTIEAYRITHSHFVPTMFQRLLALPEEARNRFDVSSLKYVIHGAAPCPPEVKRAMIAWFGPIIHEYYSATEGGAGFKIDSEEWLAKPGSVGKRPPAPRVRILDDEGQDCPPNVAGKVYVERPAKNGFSYYKDDGKTRATHIGDFFTVGDIGHFDEDDYLFLTGRSADCIISGGVNIYPQEIDDALLVHPAVEDSATIGVPNAEWGEEVKSVIKLKPGFSPSDDLAADIIAAVRNHIAHYKAPKSIDFVETLPRNLAGKIERAKVRAPYWQGRAVQI